MKRLQGDKRLRLEFNPKELKAAINRLAREGELFQLQSAKRTDEVEKKIIEAVEGAGLYVRSLKTERDYPGEAKYTVIISCSRGITVDTGGSVVDL